MKFSLMISVVVLILGSLLLAGVEKIMERTLFAAEDNAQDYRFSEAALLPLDQNRNLLLAVSVFGDGGHDHSPAEILGWRSSDGGRNWGQSFVFQENIGKQNVMSPSFLRLPDGELLFFFLVTNSIEDAGMWLRRSRDSGKTWDKPVRLPYEGYGGAANDHAVLLRTGRIVLPCWVSRDSLASSYSYCLYSDDRGQTWKRSNEITVREPSRGRKTSPAAEEPAVVELKDGRLLMLMRTYVGSFYRSHSTDGGATWSEPVDSGIPAPGAMPTLVRVPNNDLLLLFNYGEPGEIEGPWPRNRMASLVSKDEGESFSSLRILDGGPDFQGKMTMANITFLGNNALIFYSKSPSKKNLYSLVQQIIPLEWFYEGDRKVVFGQQSALRNTRP